MQTTAMTQATLVTRAGGVIDAEIDNEIVALKIETGLCYGFNEIGSEIWKLLATPISVGDVCKKLLSEYRIDAATCERQIIELLMQLQYEGLVQEHSNRPGE